MSGPLLDENAVGGSNRLIALIRRTRTHRTFLRSKHGGQHPFLAANKIVWWAIYLACKNWCRVQAEFLSTLPRDFSPGCLPCKPRRVVSALRGHPFATHSPVVRHGLSIIVPFLSPAEWPARLDGTSYFSHVRLAPFQSCRLGDLASHLRDVQLSMPILELNRLESTIRAQYADS